MSLFKQHTVRCSICQMPISITTTGIPHPAPSSPPADVTLAEPPDIKCERCKYANLIQTVPSVFVSAAPVFVSAAPVFVSAAPMTTPTPVHTGPDTDSMDIDVTQCVICFETFRNAPFRCFGCLSSYHDRCIKSWARVKGFTHCPKCNINLDDWQRYEENLLNGMTNMKING